MSNLNVRFKEGADGKKPVVYYVDSARGQDGLPEKAKVHEVLVMGHFFPTPPMTEIYYRLSDGRMMNDAALFERERDAQKEADDRNEMMRQAFNGTKKIQKSPKE